MTLAKRVIVITGATAGIGRACAELFAGHGAHLVLTGRRQERLAELAAALPQGKAHTIAFDICDRQATLERLSQLPAPFNAPDVLINNAGLALGLEPFHELKLDDIERMVDTNIKGTMVATHALLPGMVERGRGHIVNLVGLTQIKY